MTKIICPCFNISDKQLREALLNGGIGDLEQFMDKTKAGTACGQCKIDLEKMLETAAESRREMEEPNV